MRSTCNVLGSVWVPKPYPRTKGLLALRQLRGAEVGARKRCDAVHDHQPHVALDDRRFQALQPNKL